ncbi:MAG: histidine kinase N-terminal 7TM domain-containing protein, partial [Bacillota bacterium]|nr:histidine kinase N-terminal 7TM domain-containing protein [Bacillota bacterium]
MWPAFIEKRGPIVYNYGMGITLVYSFISILIAAVDFIIAAMSFAKKTDQGRYLGITCITAAVVDCAYLVTTTTDNYFINSVFASIYFAGISFMLNILVIFVFVFTNTPRKSLVKTLIKISLVYLAFEIVIFAINPFKEIVIGYQYRGGVISMFSYNMKTLYLMHLCYSYILVAAVFFMLIYAALRVAWEYKKQYFLCAIALGAIVLINSIFLYVPDFGIVGRIDVSVLLYSIAAIFFYWACFAYPKQWMEGVLKSSIFDSLDLGIILFGYNDNMIFCNEKIKGFIPFLDFEKGGNLDEF